LTYQLFPEALPLGTLYMADAVDIETQTRMVTAVKRIITKAPLVHARTRSGGVFSAGMTNCGRLGWWSNNGHYRYTSHNPVSGAPWPKMPLLFRNAIKAVMKHTPWHNFVPDACLINHYRVGAKMGLHQDKDERDLTEPIVTVCLADSADFLVGGTTRLEKPKVLLVHSGDVVVMGARSRLRFHGIRKVYPGTSPLKNWGDGRLSLTFRKAS